MVSFCLVFPLVLVALGSVLACALVLTARTFLDVETYALARAHLYGNQPSRCKPGTLWGELNPSTLDVRYDCAGESRVRGHLLWQGRNMIDADIDLQRGEFLR